MRGFICRAPAIALAGARGSASAALRTPSSPLDARRPAAIRADRRFPAAPERVFGAWLDPHIAGEWLFATSTQPAEVVAIDARVGGWFRFVERRPHESVDHIGEFVEIVPAKRLVFTLSIERHPHVTTRVSVDILRVPGGCELRLQHVNVPLPRADYLESRWIGMLYGLGQVLSD